jgi:glycine cleavage system transcriptional repressor
MPAHVVISLMSRDRVGIIAAVAKSIFSLGGTIGAISQTVMDEYFTILLTADFPGEPSLDEVRQGLEAAGSPGEFYVSVRQRDSAQPRPPQARNGDGFVLTLTGRDRPDIISRVSAYLAGRAINIIDLFAHTRGDAFLLISQVVVPRDQDIMQLQIDLKGLWKDYPLAVHLQHEDIFAATNEIAFTHSKI